jgi:plastocyanin
MPQKFRAVATALAIVLAITGRSQTARCDGPAAKISSQNVGGIDAQGAGTITGVVLFTGTKPPAKPIADIAGNAFCQEQHKGAIPVRDTFVFGTNAGRDTLQNVLVYVSKGLEGKEFEPTKTPVLLDQSGCMYSPHVVAVMTGQTLVVRNSDATLHNVMCTPRENPPFNIGMPVAGGTTNLVFKAPEMKMNTKCFMHPWMSAYIHVLEHPFFAVTGPDGTFTIKGLPPGEYEISVLHEASLMDPAPATASVTIAAGEKKEIEFTYHNKSDQK